MTIQRLHSSQRMSRTVIHNNTIYLCGQVCLDDQEDITGQTRTTLDKIEKLLIEAGSSKQHILSVTIYLKSMGDFAAMNSIWDNWIEQKHAPARACVEAAMARDSLLVEMSVIATTQD